MDAVDPAVLLENLPAAIEQRKKMLSSLIFDLELADANPYETEANRAEYRRLCDLHRFAITYMTDRLEAIQKAANGTSARP